MSYGIFASFYDELTQNVDYKAYAERLDGIISCRDKRRRSLVDLGCGTGSLSFELEKLGYFITGVDLSCEMLSIAYDRKAENGSQVMFVNQDMTKLSLPYKADVVVCSLDALNHLDGLESIKKTFLRVKKYLEADGVFIFDMNTVYKHREVLKDNAFVYDIDGAFIAWQNDYNPEDDSVDITLDFFVCEDDGSYSRYTEEFKERAYDTETIISLAEECGFEIRGIFDDISENAPSEKTQRILYVAGINSAKRRI